MGKGSRQAGAYCGRRWLPLRVTSCRTAPADAVYWRSRPAQVLDWPAHPGQLPIPPNGLLAPSRLGPLRERMRRRPWSSPVCVACAEDAGSRDSSPRGRLALADLFEPRFNRRLRYKPLQLTAQEFLHGLASTRGAGRNLISDFLGDASYCDLHCHESIMTC